MKNIMLNLLAILITYLVFSFVLAQFDPFMWSMDTRAALVMCCFFSVFIVLWTKFCFYNG